MSLSVMSIVLKGCFVLFKCLFGLKKDGQDDIIWYEATRQANGTYTVNVQATKHKNSTGLYNIHLYYILMMVHKLVSVAQRRQLNSVMLRLKRKPISLTLIQKQVVLQL